MTGFVTGILCTGKHGYLTLLVVALVGLFASAAAAMQSPQLWLGVVDNLNVRGVVTHTEFPELFATPSKWPIGLASLDVFQFRAAYLIRQPASEIHSIVKFLKRHKVGVGVAISALPGEDCGRGLEGMTSEREVAAEMRVLTRRRIPVSAFSIDEPLYYGHDSDLRGACGFSVRGVADRLARSLRIIQKSYPVARIILTEPVLALRGGPQELRKFLLDYKRATGELPEAVRFDINWRTNWKARVPAFINALKSVGVGFGIIFNATGAPRSDRAWVASAERNTLDFKSSIHEAPDHVVIQSWNANPKKNIPESDSYSMTGFLRWYVTKFRSPSSQVPNAYSSRGSPTRAR